MANEGQETNADVVADLQTHMREREQATCFEVELRRLINRYSQENASNTPDWILAQYLRGCLSTFNVAVQQRETWYGRNAQPTAGSGPVPVVERKG